MDATHLQYNIDILKEIRLTDIYSNVLHIRDSVDSTIFKIIILKLTAMTFKANAFPMHI